MWHSQQGSLPILHLALLLRTSAAFDLHWKRCPEAALFRAFTGPSQSHEEFPGAPSSTPPGRAWRHSPHSGRAISPTFLPVSATSTPALLAPQFPPHVLHSTSSAAGLRMRHFHLPHGLVGRLHLDVSKKVPNDCMAAPSPFPNLTARPPPAATSWDGWSTSLPLIPRGTAWSTCGLKPCGPARPGRGCARKAGQQ